MDAALLIDSLVRQTTVLIAEVATASGSRARLAHVADDVFRSLVGELRQQGVSNKGIADMFGLTLRTYHKKMARLAQSEDERGRQLREDIYRFIGERQTVRKAEVLTKFTADEPVLVAGLLRDLVASELVFSSGSGATTAYRIARSDELPDGSRGADERLERLLWIVVQRLGPIGLDKLTEIVPAEAADVDKALGRLRSAGHVEAVTDSEGTEIFRSDGCFIPPEDPAGWEAAFFDHFQAVIATLTARLRRGAKDPDDVSGGATFSFELWPDHPLLEEALGLLSDTRARARALRERVKSYNQRHREGGDPLRVVFYAGQAVIGADEE